MSNGGETEPDPTRPDVGWGDPTPADEQHPRSAFPGAGERVSDAERQAALEASLDLDPGEAGDAGEVPEP